MYCLNIWEKLSLKSDSTKSFEHEGKEKFDNI